MKERLIKAIDSMASHINKISKWDRSFDEPFGHIESKTQVSYIYEFYCYIRFIKELKVDNSIEFDNTGALRNLFPKSSANKESGYAKFVIKDDLGETLYDICAGINIHHSSIHGYSYAPDISIQTRSSSPNEDDVFLIIDAKYKNDSNDELPLRQLREFRAIITDFNLPRRPMPSNIILRSTEFTLPTLVTNGRKNYNHEPYECWFDFKQIGNFQP